MSKNEKVELLYQYIREHYSEDFAIAITGYMNTDFTAGWLLKYIRAAKPRKIELIIDEMLSILEFRDSYVKKQIARGRKINMNDLYIRSFDILWNDELRSSYVHNIAAIADMNHFEFGKNITFFVGENGSGKSTLLEGLAVAYGFSAEGGTRNYRFRTYDDYSLLSKAVKIQRERGFVNWSYFLRAESFYNVATAGVQEYGAKPGDERMPDYHVMSHGESFLKFIQRRDEPGLYILDEPEAALSPQRQMTLLIHLVKMARAGSQFIIVTHSPILLATPDLDIYSFDSSRLEKITYEETESYRLTKLFIENREYMLNKLLKED